MFARLFGVSEKDVAKARVQTMREVAAVDKAILVLERERARYRADASKCLKAGDRAGAILAGKHILRVIEPHIAQQQEQRIRLTQMSSEMTTTFAAHNTLKSVERTAKTTAKIGASFDHSKVAKSVGEMTASKAALSITQGIVKDALDLHADNDDGGNDGGNELDDEENAAVATLLSNLPGGDAYSLRTLPAVPTTPIRHTRPPPPQTGELEAL